MKNIIDIMDIETSIVSLYEASISSNKLDESSILADIEDTINSGDKEVDKFTQFGKLFSFDQIQFASDSTAVFFNAPTLKKLTKGMDYINSKINLGICNTGNICEKIFIAKGKISVVCNNIAKGTLNVFFTA